MLHRAEMQGQGAIIELVDYNEVYVGDTKAKKTTRRSRRGGAKSTQSEVKESTINTEENIENKQATNKKDIVEDNNENTDTEEKIAE